MSSRRRAALRVALVLFSLVLALVAGEIAARAYLHVHPAKLRLDDELGWCTVEGLHDSWVERDPDGRQRPVSYSTDWRGYRVWSDLTSPCPHVLVLGDSFTQAVDVSDDENYAALLRKDLGVEVFAYGVGGYGTLQEERVLARWAGVVRPDVVLWQFCTNDFINNDLELERASRIDNNGMRRPYLAADGTVEHAVPKSWAWLRDRIDVSRLLLAVFVSCDRIGARSGPTVETEIARLGREHPGFARSSATTEKLLFRAKAHAGRARFVAFCADEREPYFSEIRRICERASITFFAGPSSRIREAERAGECVRSCDCAHWNDRGHRICAEALAEALRPMLATR